MLKSLFILSIFSVFALTTSAQTESTNPKYDKALADSLGADDYGMKSYVLVILKTGPEDKNITDKPIRDSLFQGHFSNMNKMAKEGKLIVAGPIGKNDKTFRGIFILNVKTIEEAQSLAQTDPSIQAGIFAIECYPWYGSAALPMYLNFSDMVEKIKM